MYTVAVVAGRVLEARVFGLRTLEDVNRYEHDIRLATAGHTGQLIGVCDLRAADHAGEIFAPDVADAVLGLLTRTSPRMEKSAILLPRGAATFHLQMDRLVRESKHPGRRAFREAADLKAWLSGSLTPAERERLERFLSEDLQAARAGAR